MSISAIPNEALGAPLRLAYNQDGSVKFSKLGKPTIKVAKDISDNVKLIRENFVAGLQNYSHAVINEHPEKYKAEVQKSLEAGKPIQQHDSEKLNEAMDRLVQQALEHADNAETPNDKELVPA
jgi:hypothetical protein